MDDRRTLTTALSQVLVAFAIECDNEAERLAREKIPKRIFLISLAFWSSFLRYVDDERIAVRDLQSDARIGSAQLRSVLNHLARWRYVEMEPAVDDDRARPPFRDWSVRPTRLGRFTRRIWPPIVTLVEERYRARFGSGTIDRLRLALESIVDRFEGGLPTFLPILGYDWFARVDTRCTPIRKARDLPTLLSDVLLAYTLEFERESPIPYPIGCNVLRVLAREAIPLREMPLRTGIAKETILRAVASAARAGLATVEAGVARGKTVTMAPKGRRAFAAFRKHDALLNGRWRSRFGAADIEELHATLDMLLDARDGETPTLAAGLVPPAGGWRGETPYRKQTELFLADPRAALPHYPMITHRGGWPDGN